MSWASRRMRRAVSGGGPDRWRRIPRRGRIRQPAAGPTAGSSRGTSGASPRPAGSSARPARARSASGPRTARSSASSQSASRSTSASGTYVSRPAPITRRGTSGSAVAVDRHALEHLSPGPAGLERLLAEQVLDAQHVGQRQVPVLALQLLGQRLPAQLRATVRVGDVAHDVGSRRVAQVPRRLGRDQHVGGRGHALERLEHEQAAQAVAHGHHATGRGVPSPR